MESCLSRLLPALRSGGSFIEASPFHRTLSNPMHHEHTHLDELLGVSRSHARGWTRRLSRLASAVDDAVERSVCQPLHRRVAGVCEQHAETRRCSKTTHVPRSRLARRLGRSPRADLPAPADAAVVRVPRADAPGARAPPYTGRDRTKPDRVARRGRRHSQRSPAHSERPRPAARSPAASHRRRSSVSGRVLTRSSKAARRCPLPQPTSTTLRNAPLPRQRAATSS